MKMVDRAGPVERELTGKEFAFVWALVTTGCSRAEAARQAGYADSEHEGVRLVRRPAVQAAMHRMTQEHIQEHAPAALNTLKTIMQDEAASKGVRATCAKEILDRAGHTAKVIEKYSDSRKPMDQMSADELEELIRKGNALIEAERAAQPQILDVTPNNTQNTKPGTAQVIDIKEQNTV